MLLKTRELSQCVWISAFDAKPVDVGNMLKTLQEKAPDIGVQIVDLDRVAGSRYLFSAVFNALRSFKSKQAIAKSLSMEILLYVAANRQIEESLKRVGVTENTRRVAAVAVGDSENEVTNTAVLLRKLFGVDNRDKLVDEWSAGRVQNVRSLFGIGDKELRATKRKNEGEIKALERLAIERSAMLTIKK